MRQFDKVERMCREDKDSFDATSALLYRLRLSHATLASRPHFAAYHLALLLARALARARRPPAPLLPAAPAAYLFVALLRHGATSSSRRRAPRCSPPRSVRSSLSLCSHPAPSPARSRRSARSWPRGSRAHSGLALTSPAPGSPCYRRLRRRASSSTLPSSSPPRPRSYDAADSWMARNRRRSCSPPRLGCSCSLRANVPQRGCVLLVPASAREPCAGHRVRPGQGFLAQPPPLRRSHAARCAATARDVAACIVAGAREGLRFDGLEGLYWLVGWSVAMKEAALLAARWIVAVWSAAMVITLMCYKRGWLFVS
jgi:hypothetical protein